MRGRERERQTETDRQTGRQTHRHTERRRRGRLLSAVKKVREVPPPALAPKEGF